MKKMTEKEFALDLAQAHSCGHTAYKRLDSYTHSHTKIRLECSTHGIFLKTPSSILKGRECPKCSIIKRYAGTKERRESDYRKQLHALGITLKGKYEENKRLSHFCLECRKEFLALRTTVLKGLGCPTCSNRVEPKTSKRYTSEVFEKELAIKQPNLSLVGKFKRLGAKIELSCQRHGKFTKGAKLALSTGCPSCRKEELKGSRLLDRELWVERIKEKHGNNVRLLGQYRGVSTNTKYRFKCYTCLNTWKAQLPSVAQTGTGCPHCNNTRKGKFNSRIKEYTVDGTTFRVEGWEYQAIVWMLETKNLIASDIFTESTSKVPVIPYTLGKRNRHYYPDIFIPKWNRIIEVKSSYTLGLGRGKRCAKTWRTNQAKAKSVIAHGYKFTLLVMGQSGTRYKLPKNWYEMSRKEALVWLAFRNGNYIPEGVESNYEPLGNSAKTKLRQEVKEEKDKNARRKRMYLANY